MKYKVINNLKLYLFIILLGATVGLVLWVFLKAIKLCTYLLWTMVPAAAGVSFIPVIICAAGGLLMGLIHWKYYDYPEELPVVLGKIRRNRHYDYDHMAVLLICAFLPLVFGASVGPEAGLTGIIAGLCYWIGDNVKYAKVHAAEYSDIGAAVMLGSLFHAPLFGIFAVEENASDEEHTSASTEGQSPGMPKVTKVLLYGLSVAAAFFVMKGLGLLFGAAAEGFPAFEAADAAAADYVLALLYVPVGLILYLIYRYTKKLMALFSSKLPVIVRETLCGICVGIMAVYVPAVCFSGEDQMSALPEVFMTYAPAALMGVSLLKILMTTLCIEFGLKGGHFFPLIYACSCMGFGMVLLIFSGGAAAHAVFAAAIVTASALGAQMKKPFAVTMLLMICFPFRLALWILLAAAIGSKVGALFADKKDNQSLQA